MPHARTWSAAFFASGQASGVPNALKEFQCPLDYHVKSRNSQEAHDRIYRRYASPVPHNLSLVLASCRIWVLNPTGAKEDDARAPPNLIPIHFLTET
jgi:hypothetical protein